MKSLSDRVDEYLKRERTTSSLLDTPVVLAHVVAATKLYSGWAVMEAHADVVGEPPEISADTEISNSEWSVIRPLFILYVEKEEAFQLEASRLAGIEVFGRSSSEVVQEIHLYETERLPKLAFSNPITTV